MDPQTLSPDEELKLTDLKRIYGTKGLADLICVKRETIEKCDDVRAVRSGIRRFWKKHMGNNRSKLQSV